ncbi:MAG TPA: hypothetical protein VHE60_02170 [Pyrinomonadaceae bacterium]|nr:hypothetical protein [Pyrinomonadaceae bacterium]
MKVRLANSPLNAADLRSKVRQQGLEVTVYADGFERGLYATVSVIKPKALFRARTKGDGLAPAVQAQRKIPGLEKLVITNVATRLDKPLQSILQLPSPVGTTTGEWVTVRLEGLDPGIEYTFRATGGRSVVTCQAVVCPVDTIPTAANRAEHKPNTKR